MKVVIFGGGGFIGSAIADRLLMDGHEIRIFERPRVEPYRKFNEQELVEWVTGDFSSAHDVSEAMQGAETVVHLISSTLPKNSNEDPIFDVQSNVISSLQMLNTMVEQNVRNIVFISSGGTVYGKPEYIPIDEVHPTNPLVSYGITKLAIEKYLQLYERLHGIKAIVLRVPNPYGERQRIETAQGAVSVFLHRALKGVPVDIWGDGSVTRDYIHVADVAAAFAKAVEYTGGNRIFNISSGVGISLNELLQLLENSLGRPVERRYLMGRPFDVPVNVLSNKLACNELNWMPEVSMQTGIKLTIKWMNSQLVLASSENNIAS